MFEISRRQLRERWDGMGLTGALTLWDQGLKRRRVSSSPERSSRSLPNSRPRVAQTRISTRANRNSTGPGEALLRFPLLPLRVVGVGHPCASRQRCNKASSTVGRVGGRPMGDFFPFLSKTDGPRAGSLGPLVRQSANLALCFI